MTDWVFVLVPLLVLPIVLLFRFVGCGLDTKGEVEERVATEVPPYNTTILAEPSVLAYWRLVDGPAATKAKEEKGSSPSGSSPLDGEYKKVPPPGLPLEEPTPVPGSVPPTTSPGSEAANGNFFTGVDSLIAFDSANCRIFNGGYVLVAGFSTVSSEGGAVVKYPENFTIEAWIDAQWTQKTGYEHTLIGAGGNYRRPLDPDPSPTYWHGFRIFADHEDRWQVYLAQPNGSRVPVKMKTAPPIVVHSNESNKVPAEPTHLAVTVKTDPPNTSKMKVTVFVNGNHFCEGTADSYSPPNGAPLFIGVSNMEFNPSNPARPRHPVLSPIQEVVLYSKALPPEDIKKHHNAGKGIA